jgi:hypothetical protein
MENLHPLCHSRENGNPAASGAWGSPLEPAPAKAGAGMTALMRLSTLSEGAMWTGEFRHLECYLVRLYQQERPGLHHIVEPAYRYIESSLPRGSRGGFFSSKFPLLSRTLVRTPAFPALI